LPKGSCGDGIKDSGEECDNGSANSDGAACTKLCKKNVCGDGKPLIGLEECDNGTDNGKITCSADYGSSCLSCSVSCRWAATAGGYCGDSVKNGPEQCDGKDGSAGTTCASLGFDYAKDGYTVACSPTDPKSCTVFSPITVTGDSTTCSSACVFSGCARCSDPIEDSSSVIYAGLLLASSVTGTVMDGITPTASVPNARVTLLFNGVKSAETNTKADGTFRFNKVNRHPACSSYKIIVDFYGDNPNTTFNESINGGYWPYTSETFVPKGSPSLIYLLPRVAKYETLVSVEWTGLLVPSAGGSDVKLKTSETIEDPRKATTFADIDAHLLLPYAFSAAGISTGDSAFTDTTRTYSICNPSTDVCVRDINYGVPGLSDLGNFPHAKLVCLKDGRVGDTCVRFNIEPETLKYTRKYTTLRMYDFYLSDAQLAWSKPKKNYKTPLNLTVLVLTNDGLRTFKPEPPGYCSAYKGVWHVFQQSADGTIFSVDAWQAKKDFAGKALTLNGLGFDESTIDSSTCESGGTSGGTGGSVTEPTKPSGGTGGSVTEPTKPSGGTGGSESVPLPSTDVRASVGVCTGTGVTCCDKDPAHLYKSGTFACTSSACYSNPDGTYACKPYCNTIVTTDCCKIATTGFPTTAERTACISSMPFYKVVSF